jgi:hypothetical protein
MNLDFQNKKIACSFNDFCNNDFNNFIINLNKKNKLTLYSSQKTAKKIFKNKLKIKILNKNYILYNFLKLFSKSKKSSLQNFYFLQKILNEKLLFKFFYIFRLAFYKFGLLIDINLLRIFLIKITLENVNYDYIITDFRFNEVYSNHEIINYARKNKVPIIVILFSWDNLFSEDVNLDGDYYFVGSEQMKKILHNRHKIPLSKIFKHMPFQFLYLLQKKKKIMEYNTKDKYILYSCCVEENSQIAEEEFEIINHIAKFLTENKINLKIYVRPYPFFSKVANLKKKIKYPNIFILNYGNVLIRRQINNQITYMRFEKDYKKKLKLLNNAILHINFLSTIGIESCLLNKPTLFLNFKKNFNWLCPFEFFKSNFFKTKYLDHYKIFSKNKMFVTNYDELDSILLDIFVKKIKNFNIKNNNFIKNFFL